MAERSYYEVMALPETASSEEIKKQYRLLARKYHPDVNPGPQAAQQFSAIAEAYRVLSDSEARRVYDADLALKQRRTGPRAGSPVSHPAAPRPSASPTPAAPQTTAVQEAERLVQQAQVAFSRNRMAEARSLAEQALRYHKRSATAWEVLGDVCRNQERYDDALRHYTMASQYNPRSNTIPQKIERIARRPSSSGSTAGGYVPATPIRPNPSATGRSSARASAPVTTNLPQEKHSLALVLVGFFGYFGTLLILIFTGLYLDKSDASTHVLPIVDSWSWPLVACMALAGTLLGATMTITGAIRRIEDDLILSGSGGGRTVPFGIFMIAIGLVFFWAAAALHLVISLVQEALTPSRLRLYGAIALLTVFFAISWTAQFGTVQTLTWGGNILFLFFLIGWLLGDFFRPD